MLYKVNDDEMFNFFQYSNIIHKTIAHLLWIKSEHINFKSLNNFFRPRNTSILGAGRRCIITIKRI